MLNNVMPPNNIASTTAHRRHKCDNWLNSPKNYVQFQNAADRLSLVQLVSEHFINEQLYKKISSRYTYLEGSFCLESTSGIKNFFF